ncbi:mechanosensitive ion channel domain-containing protein [Immundisolibacter sp.]
MSGLRPAERPSPAGLGRALRRALLWLTLCGLGCVVTAARAATDDPPDATLIAQRLAAVQADPSLGEAERGAVVAQLQAAQSALEDAAAQNAEREQLLRSVQRAPGRIAALHNASSPQLPSPPSGADVTNLSAALAEAQAALEAALAERDRWDRRVQSLTQAPITLQAQLTEARANLQALDTAASSEPAAGALADATALARAARRSALLAGIALREEQLRTVEVRRELAQAERDAAERQAAALQDQVSALSARLSAARQALARQELDDAEALVASTADADPLVREAAARLAELTRELAGVLQADDQTGAAIEQVQARQGEVEALYRAAQAQLELAELGGTLTQALHNQRLRLPRPGDYRRDAAARNRDIGEARLRQLGLAEQRRALGLPYQRADELVRQRQPPLEEDQRVALRQQLGGLLRAQADLMGRLDNAYGRRIALLSDLGRRQQQLLQVAQNYASLLDRRLLWTPDVDPLGLAWLRAWPPAAHELLQPARWAELPAALVTTLVTRPLAALALLLPLVLLALRGRLRQQQLADALRLVDIHRDSAWYTALSLVYTALHELPWPLLMYLLGRLLACGSAEATLADASGAALSGMAPAVFVLGFMRELARNGGVLDAHYQWQATARQIVRRQVVRLRLLAVPAGLLVIFTERLGQAAPRATIGRLAFVAFSLGLAIFLWRTLHPQRGAPAAYLAARPDSRLWRWRRVWHPLAAGSALLPAVLAMLGFYYAAVQIQARAVQTGWCLLGVLLVYYLVLRALAVTQRRLRLRQALAPDVPADDEDAADDALDIEAVDEQARRLLGFVRSLAIVGVLLWAWADLLPALQSLDQIVLWRYRLGGEAGAASGVVTLLSLLLAGGVAAVTVLASRNLPGALEIAVLQRLDMDAGARYAAITVTRYVIVTVGALVAVNLLGVEWAKAQWLVAALGVGIGFGLQEIIANFISGLIILAERPFRVGDIVTVGGVSGNVTRIRIRATTITDFDRKELIVPNKTFITEQFVNWTLSDQVLRVTVKVGVAYGSDTQRVCGVLADVAGANRRVARDPAPQVLFTGFGDSALEFEVRVYVRALQDSVPAQHELHMAINQALREAGIEIPFPQRDMHLRSVSAQAAQAIGRGAADADTYPGTDQQPPRGAADCVPRGKPG